MINNGVSFNGILVKVKRDVTIVLAVILMLLCGDDFSFAGQTIKPANLPISSSEKESLLTSTKFRLIIKDFIMTSGDKRYNVLQRSLPDLIAVGLLDNENVEYVPHKELKIAALKKQQPEQLPGTQSKEFIYDSAVLDERGIKLVITGNFYESNGKINITAYLENRTKKEEPKTFFLNPATTDEIYSVIKKFTRDLADEINLIADKPTPVFAVLCFKDSSKAPADSNKWREKDTTLAVLSKVKAKKQIKLISVSDAEKSCENDAYTAPRDTDAVINGMLSIKGDQITISPELYIVHPKSSVPLLPQTDSISNYYVMTDRLAKEMSSVIDAIVDKNGALNVEPLLFKTDTAGQYVEKGKEYFERGNLYVASMMFSKSLELDPDYGDGHYNLGVARYLQGSDTEALKEFEKAIDIINNKKKKKERLDNRLEAKVHQGIGKTYLAQKKYETALRSFEEAADVYPGLEGIYYNLGETYYISGNAGKAIQKFKKALEKDPANSQIQIMLGRAYLSQKLFDESINSYKGALQITPSDDQILSELNTAYKEKGMNLIKKKEFDGALKNYDEALTFNYLRDSSGDLYFYKGYVLDKLKKHLEAEEAYTQSIKIRPQSDAYINRGNLYYEKLKEHDKAVEDYSKAIELDPKYVLAYNNRAVVYDNQNKLDKALEDYNKAIELDPKYVLAYDNRALLYEKQNKSDKAVEDYSKAIELNPKDAFAYLNRGVSYYNQDKYDKAFEDYSKAIELDPKYALAYNNRGLVHEKQNKLEKALDDYNKAVEINPEFIDAYIHRGYVYGKLNRFEKASDDYRKAVELKTPVPSAYLNLSEALIISESYKKALDNIGRSFPLMVELKDKTINLYLKCITEKLLDMDASGSESALNQMLKQKIDLTWSFEEIETWAANANISDYAKNYIKEKSAMLKKYRQ